MSVPHPLAVELRRLIKERQEVSDQLMREHEGKPAQWVRSRLDRIDRLSSEIASIKRRLA